MGFFGRLFGTAKAAEEAVSTIRDGLDALVYTDEEKAHDAAKERAEGRQLLVEWIKASQGQNLSRRIIALSVCAVWLAGYVQAYLFAFVAIWAQDGVRWQASATLAQDSAATLNDYVWIVLAFYFAAPHMGSFAEALFNKLKSR